MRPSLIVPPFLTKPHKRQSSWTTLCWVRRFFHRRLGSEKWRERSLIGTLKKKKKGLKIKKLGTNYHFSLLEKSQGQSSQTNTAWVEKSQLSQGPYMSTVFKLLVNPHWTQRYLKEGADHHSGASRCWTRLGYICISRRSFLKYRHNHRVAFPAWCQLFNINRTFQTEEADTRLQKKKCI